MGLVPCLTEAMSLLTMYVSDTSSTLTFSNSDEFDEHTIWNPMLGLLCHAHVGVSLEQLCDDEDLEKIALSCHFALDVLLRQN